MDADKETILTRLVSLDTPGKATVEVVILADPVSVLLSTYPQVLSHLTQVNHIRYHPTLDLHTSCFPTKLERLQRAYVADEWNK